MSLLKRASLACLFAVFAAPAAFGQDCQTTIEGNDQMQYNKDTITINRSCDEFTVELVHVGDLPAQAMGHNIVFTSIEDRDGVAQEAMAHEGNDYVPPEDDRVIAASDLVGGGESTTVVLDPDDFSEDGDYGFVCTFPGHAATMRGSLEFEG